jgi:hypothetical protein
MPPLLPQKSGLRVKQQKCPFFSTEYEKKIKRRAGNIKSCTFPREEYRGLA